ncbi:MAG TPA: hypothetical protein VEQ60_30390, partial [Longimicrobium sp.]|nr:hypothetical protein [Longimicrobium sp.]
MFNDDLQQNHQIRAFTAGPPAPPPPLRRAGLGVGMKTAHAFFERVGVPPYQGSVELANAYLVQGLEKAGYRTQVHGPVVSRSKIERLLPLNLAKARAELVAASPSDLALYDDGSLSLCPPGRQWARRSAVFYH